MSTLPDTYMLLIYPGCDRSRLFWCEQSVGRYLRGVWRPEVAADVEVDFVHLNGESGEITLDLAASARRWGLLRAQPELPEPRGGVTSVEPK